MDDRASGTPVAVASPSLDTPGAASPTTPQSAPDASPVVPYAGKFDPKAHLPRRRLLAPRHHSPAALGAIQGHPITGKASAPIPSVSTGQLCATYQRGTYAEVGTGPALQHSKPIGGVFGFHKTTAEPDKGPSKRKLDCWTTKRYPRERLAKLPDIALEDADNTPYNNQDGEEDDDSDADNFAGTEEEAAAAARALHERREERLLQQSMAMGQTRLLRRQPLPPMALRACRLRL